MYDRIIAYLDSEVKPCPAEAATAIGDPYGGIACHCEGGSRLGWCSGCEAEAQQREAAIAQVHGAHAACDYQDPPDYEGIGDAFPEEYIDRLAMHNAMRDLVRSPRERMVRR